MIKSRLPTGSGRPVFFMGISRADITGLTAGQPILIHPDDLSALGLPPIQVVIHYGRTEAAIIEELSANGVSLRA